MRMGWTDGRNQQRTEPLPDEHHPPPTATLLQDMPYDMPYEDMPPSYAECMKQNAQKEQSCGKEQFQPACEAVDIEPYNGNYMELTPLVGREVIV